MGHNHNCQCNGGGFDPHFSQNVLVTENTDYRRLSNKPTINGVTIEEENSLTDFGLHSILYGTTAYWNDNLTTMSEEGTVYVYNDYKTNTINGVTKRIAGVKIGDGETYLVDLPFINGTDDIRDQVIVELIETSQIVTPEDRERWNGKINASIDINDEENLVLSVG